jgi:formylglycine-generating enzyme required for sulfatase activity
MRPERNLWAGLPRNLRRGPRPLFELARELEREGNLAAAAMLYDRAYGLDPAADDMGQARARLLDRLAVVEHGLCFRYIPGGVCLLGSDQGEEDERPWHPVWLSPSWVAETPVSWAAYCRLMGWEPPPAGCPQDHKVPRSGFDEAAFHLYEANKIRLQYCEDRTTRAGDWHGHAPGQMWGSGGQTVSAQELFGAPPRDDPKAPWRYDTKPMIAVAWQDADDLAAHLSIDRVRYTLPTEAQWEKAARGGLIGARHAWGHEPPAHDRCDFGRFAEFSIRPMRAFPPNGYGLYAVNGGVWEWTRDWYDRDGYRHSPQGDPEGPAAGEEKVLRGGSWADCAAAVTVSFRMSRGSSSWKEGKWGANLAPNIGFRLCRTVIG